MTESKFGCFSCVLWMKKEKRGQFDTEKLSSPSKKRSSTVLLSLDVTGLIIVLDSLGWRFERMIRIGSMSVHKFMVLDFNSTGVSVRVSFLIFIRDTFERRNGITLRFLHVEWWGRRRESSRLCFFQSSNYCRKGWQKQDIMKAWVKGYHESIDLMPSASIFTTVTMHVFPCNAFMSLCILLTLFLQNFVLLPQIVDVLLMRRVLLPHALNVFRSLF